MRTRYLIVFLIVTLFSTIGIGLAQDAPPQTTATVDELAERQVLAASGSRLFSQFSGITAASASSTDIVNALDVTPTLVTGVTVSGASLAYATPANFGVISSRVGDSLLVMSSGVVGAQAEPGTDFDPSGVTGDTVTVSLQISVPEVPTVISFDYSFLSSEYPEFIGSEYDDTFSAVISNASGTNEIARASVNSAEFVQVSHSNAGGTGYDLFSPGPDAGITDFRTGSFFLANGGSFILTFAVSDVGDGIYDSAVVIDNLSVGSLEILDPIAREVSPGAVEDIVENGNVIGADNPANVGSLATWTHRRTGAVADGVTRLLLRARVTGSGTGQFCITSGNTLLDGGIRATGNQSADPDSCISTQTVEYNGQWYAFAVYQTPEDFNLGSAASLASREVGITFQFIPTSGSPWSTITKTIDLYRPPLLFVHGVCSGAGAWNSFPLARDSRFRSFLVDYSGSNTSMFQQNSGVIANRISEFLYQLANDNIAAVRFDLIGHSMGGILARVHAAQPFYLNEQNYQQGSLNRIFTLNTPHRGSQLANAIVVFTYTPLGVVLTSVVDERLGCKSIPLPLLGLDSALTDLQLESQAIASIPNTDIPSHALIGRSEFEVGILVGLPDPMGAYFRVIEFLGNVLPDALFAFEPHDGVVPESSQQGGITDAPQTRTVIDGPEGSHMQANKSAVYSQILVDLLNSRITSGRFGNFTAIGSASSWSVGSLDSIAIVPLEVIPGVVISSPPSGTTVTPGSTVTVTVTPIAGAEVASVLVMGTGTAQVDDSAPFEVQLPIPEDAVGAFEVIAFGKNADATTYYTANDSIILNVTPNSTLESIDLSPDEFDTFVVGDTQQTWVSGQYSDGVLRDLTDPTTGTIYSVTSSGVATISDTGLITTIGRGSTTIIAQNGNLQDSITVNVIFANQAPVAMASAPTAVNLGESITLVGNKSFDPDSGPSSLNYEWRQVAGPIQFTESIFGSVLTFTPANPGRYTFSLVVRDGQADSPPANVSFVVIGRGDCNIDGKVDAGDASAIVLEVFDGDGDQAGDVAGGTFAGTPFGCDANNDTLIQAGDLTCTTLLVFDTAATCAATP